MVSCKYAWLEGCKSTFETSSHKSRIRLDLRSITFVQCSKQDLQVNDVTLRWDHFLAKIISRTRPGENRSDIFFPLRFRKAASVWCGGAREPRVTME